MKNFLLIIGIIILIPSFLFSQTYQEITGISLLSGFNPAIDFFDMDADGDMDLFVTGHTQSGILSTGTKLYSNDGNGNFSEMTGPFEAVGNGSIVSGDIDGDGDKDLIITGKNQSGTPSTKVYLNNGTGTFSIMGNTNLPDVANGRLRLADLDGDMDLDLMLAGSQNGSYPFNPTTKLYINNGSGNFTESTNSFDNLARDIQIFDMDLDGDKDIIISGYLNGTSSTATRIYLNNGSAIFTLSTNTIDMVGDIAVIDHNGDNYMDVIVAGHPVSSQSNAATQLYTNNGNGSFTAVTGSNFPLFSNSARMVVHDYDGDNDEDVIFIGSGASPGYGGHGTMFHNNGSGSFSENINANFTGGKNAAVGQADIDNDGKMEILMMGASASGGTIPFVRLYEEYVCTVNIPDANFKAYLVGNTEINTNGNTEIECSEASAATSMACHNQNISDLTGIEAFTSIQSLYCPGNQISSLDLSSNTNLISIDCANNQLTSLIFPSSNTMKTVECIGNQLTSLDVSVIPALEEMDCRVNSLTSINLSTNSAIYKLWCLDNQLSALDLSACIALEELACSTNPLTSLDLSNNTSLVELGCYDTQLSSLDLSSNTALEELRIGIAPITNLDLSSNTLLRVLNVPSLELTSLDVSSNPALEVLDCGNNQLTNLDVANGNNTILTNFSAAGNLNLNCIKVDDVAYSIANWANIGPTTYFSTTCSTGIENLEESKLSISPNPTTGYLHINTDYIIEQYQLFSIDGQQLLQGISNDLDISSMSKGIYILQVQTDQGIAQRKLVKE